MGFRVLPTAGTSNLKKAYRPPSCETCSGVRYEPVFIVVICRSPNTAINGRVKPVDGEAFSQSLRQREDELLKQRTAK